jgi:hypothetical protein
MTTELTTTPVENLEVTATTPLEMQQSQCKLIDWCKNKIQATKLEAAEMLEAFQQAVKNKWKSGTLKRHADLAQKRVTFYEKICAALEAGYCIIPSFPVTMFAIRTDKDKPAKLVTISERHVWQSPPHDQKVQEATVLPPGQGDYVDPAPVVETTKIGTQLPCPKNPTSREADIQRWETKATEWLDEIAFPLEMAKPRIMEAVNYAMTLKIFDELGIFLPQTLAKKKADPIIVGTVMDPKQDAYGNQRRIMFIIAWHLNLRDL